MNMILFKPSKAALKKKSKQSKEKNKDKSVVMKQKQKQKRKQRKHFRSLSIEQMNGATYSWQIRNKHELIEDILNAKNRQKFTSDEFKVGELEFCLELYPNGFDANSVGLTDLFLKLVSMPSEWTEVWINYRLFCNETLSSWTFIQKFKRGGFWGWHDGCLLFHSLKKEILSRKNNTLSDEFEYEYEDINEHNDHEENDESYSSYDDETVKKHSSTDLLSPYGDDYNCFGDIAITFSSFIQILKVNSKHGYKRNKKVVYEKILLNSNKYQFKLEWSINNELVNKFIKCENGKYFESEIFYEMWNLRISPNGCNYYHTNTNENENEKDDESKNDGNLTLFLNLCCLPPKISKIKVKYVLYEQLSDTKWKFTRDFSYTQSLSGWPDGKLLTKDLKKYKTLKFIANIYIIKMYDMKGKQIDIAHNDNLTEIKEDEQIGLDKQISTEYTKSPSPNPNNSYKNNRQSNTPELTPNNQNNNMVNASIVNSTPISPIISPSQQQTHTHNITINNSKNDMEIREEYKELSNKMSVIENKIDTISNVVILMQKQMTDLSCNVEYIKQKQIKDDEYRDNIMFILNEMTKDIANVYKSTQQNRHHSLNKKNNSHNYLQIMEPMNLMRRPNSVRIEGDKSARPTIIPAMDNENINRKYKTKRRQTSNNKLKSRKKSNKNKNKNISQLLFTQKDYLKRWLTDNVKLPQYFEIFIENGVEDLKIMMDLTINELKMIGIHQKQHQLQIQKEITKLRNSMQNSTNSLGSNLFDTV